MFTVKATYRNETRKFTFPDSALFPSYEELYHQLYRVFPIAHSIYLSRLLFSPNSPQHSQRVRILIGVEAHSAEEYDACIAPYRGRAWPNALLKFNVYDETPHKLPNASNGNRVSMLSTADSATVGASSMGASQDAGAVGWEPDHRSKSDDHRNDDRRRDDRRVFLERLRERTTSRSSAGSHQPSSPPQVCVSPPAPFVLPMPSPPFPGAQSSRPLPRRPSPSVDSSASATTARIGRPSLFDLLSQDVPCCSDAPPRMPETARPSIFELIKPDSVFCRPTGHYCSDTSVERASAHQPPAAPVAEHAQPELLNRPDANASASSPYVYPELPPYPSFSAQEHKLPVPPSPPPFCGTAQPARWPPFVVPPLPILYPECGINDMRGDHSGLRGTVTEEAIPTPAITPSPAPSVRFLGAQPADSTPQPPTQPPQPCSPARQSPMANSPGATGTPASETVEQPARGHCCSVLQGKAEVKALIEGFIGDLDETMKSAFGDEWIPARGRLSSGSRCGSRVVPACSRYTSPVPASSPIIVHIPSSPTSMSPNLSPRSRTYSLSPARFDPGPAPQVGNVVPRSPQWSSPPQVWPLPPQDPYPIPPPPPFLMAVPPSLGQFGPRTPLYTPPPVVPPPPPQWSRVVAPPPPPPPPPMPHVGSNNVVAYSTGPGALSWCTWQPEANFAPTPLRSSPSTTAPLPPPPLVGLHDSPVWKSVERDEDNSVHIGIVCDGCQQRSFKGVRYKCTDCIGLVHVNNLITSLTDVHPDFDLCSKCISSSQTSWQHPVQHSFIPIRNKTDLDQITHEFIRCDVCHIGSIIGIRFKCLECDDYDMCASCFTSPDRRREHPLAHHFFPINKSDGLAKFNNARTALSAAAQPPSSRLPLPQNATVHRAICDVCSRRIRGIRHKCLDCPDYDMCTECISKPGTREAHGVSHQFFEILRNDEVIVHTVLTGNDERTPAETAPASRSTAPPSNSREVVSASHCARCNLCDSLIYGDRYKCLNCPDFDTCSACFQITTEQHPRHGFVKISIPEQLILRDSMNASSVHNATCDSCNSVIVGDRYKCMHSACTDFDLCQSCEALPFPVHPPNHPLLKMKTPDTLVPITIRPQPITGTETSSPVINIRPIEPVLPSTVPREDSSNQDDDVIVPSRNYSPVPNIADSRINEDYRTDHAASIVSDIEENALSAGFSTHAATCSMEMTLGQLVAQRQKADQWSSSGLAPSDVSATTDLDQQASASTGQINEVNIPLTRQVLQQLPTSLKRPTWEAALDRWAVNDSTSSVPSDRNALSVEEQEDLEQLSFSQLFDRLRNATRRVPTEPPTIISIPALHEDEGAPVGSPEANAEERLVDIADGKKKERDDQAEESSSLCGLTTPSEPLASAEESTSLPRLSPVHQPEWRELWPELSSMFMHLLHPPTPSSGIATPNGAREGTMPGAMVVEEPLRSGVVQAQVTNEPENGGAVEASPLVSEPLLRRPGTPWDPEQVPLLVSFELCTRGASPILSRRNSVARYEMTRSPSPIPVSVPVSTESQPLFASFVSDGNIPDGQVFPPGAEFVKSWRMVNQGMRDWPEDTELVFVAGDRMAPHDNAPRKVKVGTVKANEEIEIVAGEMKAPDVPGKYVSYWRLSDGKGNQFGHSVWVDITVAEVTRTGSALSADHSLASSSVIMPQPVQDQPASPAAPRPQRSDTTGSEFTVSVTVPSRPSSDTGSFNSSISLVDVPASPVSDDDDAVYEHSRSVVVTNPADRVNRVQDVEYVMLYESSSEDD
ncbi:hypothetical protein WOLCODRAFT_160653 [Wolfiporia cocos MD-104 SS10]|uniref:ZZ-type domain-containing protein n=1 Tax=Wolfiporia cocos (strain MD-104) TaxID=742152 RepID=A0A2H3IWP8_WOLCO|nr:hypothetical protein WOLCODRAFT_160653 [Wolfiporia cocos MD-104 SS10]